MNWRAALDIIHDDGGFSQREMADHLGVHFSALKFWMAWGRNAKNRHQPTTDRQRTIVAWALDILSGAAPRFLRIDMPDGRVRRELLHVLPISGTCPVAVAVLRRRRQVLGLTHSELGARMRTVLCLPPPTRRERLYENIERRVGPYPDPMTICALSDALLAGKAFQLQPATIDEDLHSEHEDHAAEEDKLMAYDALLKAHPPAVAAEDVPKIIDPGEAEAVLDANRQTRRIGRRNRAILETAYLAGLRISEILALRPEDVRIGDPDSPTDFPHIHVAHGKGDRARNVPCGDRLRTRLQSWARERDPKAATFFHTRTLTPVQASYMRRKVSELCRTVGIDPLRVSPHTFRHCYATERLEAGYTLAEVKDLLGHRSMSSTTLYLHTRSPELFAHVAADPRL